MSSATQRDAPAPAGKDSAQASEDAPAHPSQVTAVLVDRDEVHDHEHHAGELAHATDRLDRLSVHPQEDNDKLHSSSYPERSAHCVNARPSTKADNGRLWRVPHYCSDCGYEYDEATAEAIPAGQVRCPMCGSARISARVLAGVIEVVASVLNASILITIHLWLAWLRIAIERARVARRARAEIMSRGGKREIASLMRQEFEASVVAVAASAHALDALYGSTVISQNLRDQWKQKGSKRHGKIREALKQVFDTGPVNDQWVSDFAWLFDLRDAAAHAEESPKKPVPHPIGTNTAPEQVDYSVESAERAVAFALSVFRWCVDHPRSNLPGAVQWATAAHSALEELERQWSGRE
jgi:DNA-directed RNA polymerase subunit RPC12/RpoP